MKIKLYLFKFLFIFQFIICFTAKVHAQKNDNKWMMGYQYATWAPYPALDFMFGQPDTIGYYGYFPMFGTCTSICNAQGLLQFYTNGVYIANKFDAPLSQSTDFNLDSLTSNTDSWNVDQCVIILPMPGSNSEYALFHISGRNLGTHYAPMSLRMSKIDMNLQAGIGEMTAKNQIIINDELTFRTLNAVKHGNGRDWWVVIGKNNSDQFYSVLLTPSGIDTVFLTGSTSNFVNGGPVRGQSSFSPDGNYLAYTSTDFGQPVSDNKLILFDFDRCNGTLSFKDSIHFDTTLDSVHLGCVFSPNSRFIYANTFYDLYQYDIQSSPISSSKKHIAAFDGFSDPFPNYFYRMQSGPDNKIYMGCWGGSRYLHVINNPDQPDTLCNFVQHQLRLSGYHGGTIPFFPNYRLGPIAGSSCDTLTVGINDVSYNLKSANCYYNDNKLYLSIPESSNRKSRVEIYSLSGQLIYAETFYSDEKGNYILHPNFQLTSGMILVKIQSGSDTYTVKCPIIL